jgi:magnesium chelatase family protein
VCPPGSVQKYLNKISGPLPDRIDLHVEVVPVPFSELTNNQNGEQSKEIRNRVIDARHIQAERFKDKNGIHCNAQMTSKQVREFCKLNDISLSLLKTAMQKLNLSARAYDKILKVSRTIADLDKSLEIKTEHISEAINYRSLNRDTWGS